MGTYGCYNVAQNEETIEAMKAARRGNLLKAHSLDDLMEKLNADD